MVAFPELTIPRSQRRNDFISLLKSVPYQKMLPKLGYKVIYPKPSEVFIELFY